MNRIFHHWEKWECAKAGMYDSVSRAHSADEARAMYAEFLRDEERFGLALRRVVREWPLSCEHFLSNESINRIAWLGQASMCIETGVPRKYRGGFMLLTREEQAVANELARTHLVGWLGRFDTEQLCLSL